eukprot:gene2456-2612_t
MMVSSYYLYLCILFTIFAIQTIPAFQHTSGIVRVNSFTELQRTLQNNYFKSAIYWENEVDSDMNLYDNSFLNYLRNNKFDNSIQYKINQINESRFWELLPETHRLPAMTPLVQDMVTLAKVMALIAQSNDDQVNCRLHLMDSVRCPKWHEDDVECRLFKTYYGHGTQFVDPDDNIIRFENYVRSLFQHDRIVTDSLKVRQILGNDVVVMSGKKRVKRVPYSIPVLHRSPLEVNKSRRRLLFTVTLNT